MPEQIHAVITVVICTHNPRPDFFSATLAGLSAQTLPQHKWELLIIDNASSTSKPWVDALGWHPQARVVREEKLGLNFARWRAIREARGELLVFVDDDNVLAPDYLEAAENIAREFPAIGIFGAGKIVPRYEVEPASDLRKHCYLLSIRETAWDEWTNSRKPSSALPFGAGLCVRAETARRYLEVKEGKSQFIFGRTGQRLLSGEDTEMALMAADMGYGHGVFCRLQMKHLMSARRVERDYLLRLAEGMEMSNRLLYWLRDCEREGWSGIPRAVLVREIAGKCYQWLKARGVDRRFVWRAIRGRVAAFRLVNEIGAKSHR